MRRLERLSVPCGCRSIVTVVVCCAVFVGCRPDTSAGDARSTVVTGSDGGGVTVAGGDGGRLNHPPDNHRTVPGVCDRLRSSEIPDGGVAVSDGGCTSDEECDGGIDGRCSKTDNGTWACTYDQCFADADCPNGQVCQCRDPAMPGSPNVCLPGNCRTDSDCGVGGYCSPTLGGCAPNVGPVGYYCHTPTDQCLSTTDCNPTDTCMYLPARNRWMCEIPPDCVG